MVEQLGHNQAADSSSPFLKKESTFFNTHTRELVEGYLNPDNKNDEGFGIDDFANKMVLRFLN